MGSAERDAALLIAIHATRVSLDIAIRRIPEKRLYHAEFRESRYPTIYCDG
jgi:hypothetical protein